MEQDRVLPSLPLSGRFVLGPSCGKPPSPPNHETDSARRALPQKEVLSLPEDEKPKEEGGGRLFFVLLRLRNIFSKRVKFLRDGFLSLRNLAQLFLKSCRFNLPTQDFIANRAREDQKSRHGSRCPHAKRLCHRSNRHDAATAENGQPDRRAIGKGIKKFKHEHGQSSVVSRLGWLRGLHLGGRPLRLR